MKEFIQMRHVLSEKNKSNAGNIKTHYVNIHLIWQNCTGVEQNKKAVYESTAELHTALTESPQNI
jgi:hypothetical protein